MTKVDVSANSVGNVIITKKHGLHNWWKTSEILKEIDNDASLWKKVWKYFSMNSCFFSFIFRSVDLLCLDQLKPGTSFL